MKSSFNISLITFTVLIAQLVNAQNATKVKVPQPVEQMMQWQGKWEGKVTMQANGKTYHSTYYADFRKTANGNGLYMDERCNIPGFANLIGANLIGYDPYDGKIHWYSVDNLGTTHEHLGQFSDSNHFYMEHNSIQQGKPYVEKINLDMRNANTMSLKMTATLDTSVQETVEAEFKRK